MQSSNLGERLRLERTRLGLSQEAFGEAGGVKKFAQSNYERGKRSPDGLYLERVAKIGVDVQFVLTGSRSVSEAQPLEISSGEFSPIDVAQLVRIVERLDAIATEAGKRLPATKLIEIAADVYNYLQQEEEGAQDDEKLNRTLKLVVNR